MINKFLHLSATERSLLARLVLLLGAIRISLWVLPYGFVRRVLRKRGLASAFPQKLVHLPIERLGWAVQVASRPVPGASCLTQSFALQFLLTRAGHNSSICIGIIKNDRREFLAHAWVDCAGVVLLDRPEEVARYTPILRWEDR
jgi:hypothetical protein